MPPLPTNGQIYESAFKKDLKQRRESDEMNKSLLTNPAWYRDQELLQENHRIHFLATNDGWYHVIIEDTDITDQGTYYAYYEDSSTYVTLVVEGFFCLNFHI